MNQFDTYRDQKAINDCLKDISAFFPKEVDQKTHRDEQQDISAYVKQGFISSDLNKFEDILENSKIIVHMVMADFFVDRDREQGD